MANYKVVDADQLDTDLGTVADAIREQTGKAEQIPFPNGFASAPAELVQIGKDQKEQEWANKFYMTTVRGNDTCNLTVSLPFKPDYFAVLVYEPYAVSISNTFVRIERDFRSFAKWGGSAQYNTGANSNPIAPISNNSIDGFITWDGNNIKFICPSNMTAYKWRNECLYRILAVNYANGKTDKELLEEYVLSLPDSGGSVTLSLRRYNESGITETQWDELIAQKPNWTFVFV